MTLRDNIEVRVVPEKSTSFHYFTTNFEMLMMSFDFLDFTGDRAFAGGTLLPLDTAVLGLYYALGDWSKLGTYRLTAHATESYNNSINPSPDIAGMAAVLPRAIDAFGQDGRRSPSTAPIPARDSRYSGKRASTGSPTRTLAASHPSHSSPCLFNGMSASSTSCRHGRKPWIAPATFLPGKTTRRSNSA